MSAIIELTPAEKAKQSNRLQTWRIEQAIKKAHKKQPKDKRLASLANLIKYK